MVVLINALFFFGYAYLTVYLLIPRLVAKTEDRSSIVTYFFGNGIGLSL